MKQNTAPISGNASVADIGDRNDAYNGICRYRL